MKKSALSRGLANAQPFDVASWKTAPRIADENTRDAAKMTRIVTHAGRVVSRAASPRIGYSKASGGWQAQNRLRSPQAWSMRRTLGQYLFLSRPVTG